MHGLAIVARARREAQHDSPPEDYGDVTACFECRHCDRKTRVEVKCASREHPTRAVNPVCSFCREDTTYVGFTMGEPGDG